MENHDVVEFDFFGTHFFGEARVFARWGVVPHVLFFEISHGISPFLSLRIGYAIPAVNCVSNSGINACLEAARANDAPIIIQFSSGGSQVSLAMNERCVS